MTLVRIILVAVVIAYAGWLAWPFVTPFLEGAPLDVALARALAVAEGGEGVPRAALWVGAVLLYGVAALLLGAGNPRAAIAYFLGFMADAVLRLAIDRTGGGSGDAMIPSSPYADGGMSQRSAEAAGPMGGLPVDPTWLVLGVLMLVGLLVVAVSRRRRRHRISGQLAA